MGGLVLYELAAADPSVRFSPHCWKSRLALAHKGLEAERLAWRFTEKDRIAFSGQDKVPVLVDDGAAIANSWPIALHLEQRYPDRPSLFGGAAPLVQFINGWADAALMPIIAKLILLDIHDHLTEADQVYFRASREKAFGMPLAQVVADQPARLKELKRALAPLRAMLAERPFLAGDQPNYADYSVFGMFMWARCSSPLSLLEDGDPVTAWRDRLLDAFDGLARNAPAVGTV